MPNQTVDCLRLRPDTWHSWNNGPALALHVGAVCVIIMIFMAVTSSGASEMLAVSSLFTFDVYRRYLKPKARPHICQCTCLAVQTPSCLEADPV